MMTKRVWKALGIVLAVMLVGSIAVVAQGGNPEPELWEQDGAVRMKFAHNPLDDTGIYVNDYGEFRTLRVYAPDEVLLKPENRLHPGFTRQVFPYQTFDGPFDLTSPEAPEQDFVVHNPAFLDHWDYRGNLGLHIKADGDAYQKVHLRSWYVPCYESPLGRTEPSVNDSPHWKSVATCWQALPGYYGDVVNEYTYLMLQDPFLDPTHGQAQKTQMVFPMAAVSWDDGEIRSTQVGLEAYDVNPGTGDETLFIEKIVPVDEDTTLGEIWVSPNSVEGTDGMNLRVGESLYFFDYQVTVTNISFNNQWAQFAVYYIGNSLDDVGPQHIDTVTLHMPGYGTGKNAAITRARMGPVEPGTVAEVEAMGEAVMYPFWITMDSIGFDGGGQNVAVRPHRVLTAGETFFVDGAQYDVAAIFVLENPDGTGPEIKYITIRNPIPKGIDVEIPIISVDRVGFDSAVGLPMLPPFNMPHDRVDDVNIPDNVQGDPNGVVYPDVQLPDNVIDEACIGGYGEYSGLHCDYNTIAKRVVRDQDPLFMWWYLEDKEGRFDTSLFEEKYDDFEPHNWRWINIETRPWLYTELVLPEVDDVAWGVEGLERWWTGDYILVTSFITEDSTELWPGAGAVRAKFFYDAGQFWMEDIDVNGVAAFQDGVPTETLQWLQHLNASDIYVNQVPPAFQQQYPVSSTLRTYGRCDRNAAFPYQTYTGPFDLTSPEAPPKDFVVHNPAYIFHNEGLGRSIKTNGANTNQKVHLRQWYVPKYVEPAGMTYPTVPEYKRTSNWDVNEKGTIPLEYTYIFVQDPLNDVESGGSVGVTNMMFPMAGLGGQPGLDRYDVNNDGDDEIMRIDEVVDVAADTTLGEIWVSARETVPGGMDLNPSIGINDLQFFDYMVRVRSYSVSGQWVQVGIYYTGNRTAPDDAYFIGNVTLHMPGYGTEENAAIVQARFGPITTGTVGEVEDMVQAVQYPFWITLENIGVSGTGLDTVKIVPHRVLTAGETFFVDGMEYDVAAIRVLANPRGLGSEVQYITIRNPIDKGCFPADDRVYVPTMSVWKEIVCDGDEIPVLPPFNHEHRRVDDTDVVNAGEGPDQQFPDLTVAQRVTGFHDPLSMAWITEQKEWRFDTNLLEEKFTEPVQKWMWINIETLPWDYTEFVLPDVENVDSIGDYILVSSWLTGDSEIEPCIPAEVTLTAEPMEVFQGEVITFTADATGTEPFTFEWDFGDEGAGTLEDGGEEFGVYLFAEPGTYTVTVTVENPCGEDSDTVVIEVLEVVELEPRIFLPIVNKNFTP